MFERKLLDRKILYDIQQSTKTVKIGEDTYYIRLDKSLTVYRLWQGDSTLVQGNMDEVNGYLTRQLLYYTTKSI